MGRYRYQIFDIVDTRVLKKCIDTGEKYRLFRYGWACDVLPFGQRTRHEQQRELSKERVILKDELRNLKDELMAELIAYRCVIKVELFAILGTFVG